MESVNQRLEVVKIVIIYVVFGTLWVCLSDTIIGWCFYDPETIVKYSMVKGLLFIFITSNILYLLILHLSSKTIKSLSALHQSEERLKFLVNHSSDSLVVVNADGSQRYVSPGAEKITGFPADELEGRKLDTILHPDDMPLVNTAWQEAIDHPEKTVTVQYRHIHKKGGWVYSEAIAQSFFGDPDINGLIATVRDISEWKRAEEALSRKEALLQAMLRNLPFDFWARDTQQRVILQSDESIKLWGDLISRPGEDWGLDKKSLEYWGLDNRRVLDGEIVVKECLLTIKNGSERLFRSIIAPIRDGEKLLGILGINIDITDIKQAEAERKVLQSQLIHAQKMEAIGTLAGGIAHDFNNILSAIIGYAEMAKDSCPEGSDLAQDIDNVLASGERAAGLVQQILAFSRQVDGDPITLEPVQMVKEAIKLLRPALPSSIAIMQNINTATRSIHADPTQIHQVIMNLCTNAFHAMEDGGGILEIILTDCALSSQDLLSQPNAQPGNFVQLSIRDTGPGIDKAIQNRIFEPYFTTKEVGKGTGLGLSIVHGIVTSLGGFVVCDSKDGEGTIFTVFIPAIEQEQGVAIKQPESDLSGRERILLIDDEEILVELNKSILERLGYQVTTRSNSLDALITFQNQPEEFDAVITDQTMPGINGVDLAKRMLRIRSDIPVILCTGYSSLINEEQAYRYGIKGFVMKPLSRKILASTLRQVIDQSKVNY